VEPTPGERVVLERPDLDAATLQVFWAELSPVSQETLPLVLMANGSGHTATSLVIPHNVVGLCVPA
jgi:hypothetical protein